MYILILYKSFYNLLKEYLTESLDIPDRNMGFYQTYYKMQFVWAVVIIERFARFEYILRDL